MRRVIAVCLALVLALPALCAGAEEARALPLSEWRDAVRGAWLGKMVGVSGGRAYEFRYAGEMAQNADPWNDSLLDIALIEDDLYLPFAMMQVMDEQGIGVSGADMAAALYPYSFEFWSNHLYTFEMGFAPPYAGHPDCAPYPDALSYSFAADFTGLISPGDRGVPMELAERFGSMLVYGDGIYGGAFIGAMYAEAFFADDPAQIIRAGLAAVPEDSWLYEAVATALNCHEENPGDWTDAWRTVTDKYYLDETYNWIEWPYGGRLKGIDLDAKLNCAYIAIALLYGERDIEKTLMIANGCGQDTDSNAANALGVLFATIGWRRVPDLYRRKLNEDAPFSYVGEGFAELVKLTERLMLRYNTVTERGGVEVIVPRDKAAQPLPGRAVNSRFAEDMTPVFLTAEQLSRMKKPALLDAGFEDDWHEEIYPPWQVIGWENGANGIDLKARKAAEGRNNAYLCPAAGKEMGIAQNRIAVSRGERYVLSCQARASGADVGMRLEAVDADSGRVIARREAAGSKWYQTLSVSFTAETDIISVRLMCRSSADAWVQIDDFILNRE